jgi:hypothetical protein
VIKLILNAGLGILIVEKSTIGPGAFTPVIIDKLPIILEKSFP